MSIADRSVMPTKALHPTDTARYTVTLAEKTGLQCVTYDHRELGLDATASKREIILGTLQHVTLKTTQNKTSREFKGRWKPQSTSFLLEVHDNSKRITLRLVERDYDFDDDQSAEHPVFGAPEQRQGHATADARSSLNQQQDENDVHEPSLVSTDEAPDEENPYDYRHYLPAPAIDEPLQQAASTNGTPLMSAGIFAGPPTPRGFASDFERKPPKKSRPIAALKKTSKPPRVRLERQASIVKPASPPHAMELSSGGLIIEDSSQPTTRKPRVMTPRGGPISLHRATSTPRDTYLAASPTHTTSHDGGSEMDEDAEPHDDGEDEDDEDEASDMSEHDDADVDDLELPAPATARKEPAARQQHIWEAEESEDLLAALNDESDGEADGAIPAEEPESEEE